MAPDGVDLNSASADELRQRLPGVGAVIAQRIVAWREEHGRFYEARDLALVPGIGVKLAERLVALTSLDSAARGADGQDRASRPMLTLVNRLDSLPAFFPSVVEADELPRDEPRDDDAHRDELFSEERRRESFHFTDYSSGSERPSDAGDAEEEEATSASVRPSEVRSASPPPRRCSTMPPKSTVPPMSVDAETLELESSRVEAPGDSMGAPEPGDSSDSSDSSDSQDEAPPSGPMARAASMHPAVPVAKVPAARSIAPSASWRRVLPRARVVLAVTAIAAGLVFGSRVAERVPGSEVQKLDHSVDDLRASQDAERIRLDRQIAEWTRTRDELRAATTRHEAELAKARASQEHLTEVVKEASTTAAATTRRQEQSDERVYKLREAIKNLDWFVTATEKTTPRPKH